MFTRKVCKWLNKAQFYEFNELYFFILSEKKRSYNRFSVKKRYHCYVNLLQNAIDKKRVNYSCIDSILDKMCCICKNSLCVCHFCRSKGSLYANIYAQRKRFRADKEKKQKVPRKNNYQRRLRRWHRFWQMPRLKPKPYCIVWNEPPQALASMSMHTKRNTCASSKQATFLH